MALSKRLFTLLIATAGCAALSACGADNTAELANPGDTGSNPGVSTSGGSTTTTSTSGGNIANCPTGTTVVTVGTEQHCRLPTTLNGALRLTAGNIYQLNDRFDVGDGTGANGFQSTLTIDPGVTIYASNQNAILNINRGSRILAEGTVTSPIILTSAADLGYAATLGLPSRAIYRGRTQGDPNGNTRGEWGGVVISGFARTNFPTAVGEGNTGLRTAAGTFQITGGTNDDDDSGRLRYIQVRYAGFDLSPLVGGAPRTNEINGIAFQAVGRATQVDFIQIHQAFDDCIEFFGGAVDVKHIICDGTGDDGFDWTDGWSGRAQFVLVVHNPNQVEADNCIEADNRSSSPNLLPRSNPIISNYTCVGLEGVSGNTGVGGTSRFRAGTAGKILNGVLARARVAALEIDGPDSYAQANSGDLLFRSLFITAAIPFGTSAEDAPLAGLFNASATNLAQPSASSTLQPAVTGGVAYIDGSAELARPVTDPIPFNAAGLSTFFATTTAIGAVPSTSNNWTLGWTEFLNRGN